MLLVAHVLVWRSWQIVRIVCIFRLVATALEHRRYQTRRCRCCRGRCRAWVWSRPLLLPFGLCCCWHWKFSSSGFKAHSLTSRLLCLPTRPARQPLHVPQLPQVRLIKPLLALLRLGVALAVSLDAFLGVDHLGLAPAVRIGMHASWTSGRRAVELPVCPANLNALRRTPLNRLLPCRHLLISAGSEGRRCGAARRVQVMRLHRDVLQAILWPPELSSHSLDCPRFDHRVDVPEIVLVRGPGESQE